MSHTQRFQADEQTFISTNNIFYQHPDLECVSSCPAGLPSSVCPALACTTAVATNTGSISTQPYHQTFMSTGRIKPATYDKSSQLFFGSNRLADTYQVKHDRVRPAPQQYKAWMAEYHDTYVDPKVRVTELNTKRTLYASELAVTAAAKTSQTATAVHQSTLTAW